MSVWLRWEPRGWRSAQFVPRGVANSVPARQTGRQPIYNSEGEVKTCRIESVGDACVPDMKGIEELHQEKEELAGILSRHHISVLGQFSSPQQ
jgi:hypothetical protein